MEPDMCAAGQATGSTIRSSAGSACGAAAMADAPSSVPSGPQRDSSTTPRWRPTGPLDQRPRPSTWPAWHCPTAPISPGSSLHTTATLQMVWIGPRRTSCDHRFQAEPFLDLFGLKLSGRDAEGEVKYLVIGQGETVAVDPQEDNGGEERKPLVPVQQGVVARQRVHQRGGLARERRVGLLTHETRPGTVAGRVQQSHVPHRADA